MKIARKRVWRMIHDMSVAELPIQINREKVAGFCGAHGIRKLSLQTKYCLDGGMDYNS